MKPSLGKKPSLRIRKKTEAPNLFFSSPKTHMKFIHTGCELLNCVVGGGWPLGRMINIVGDKSTGKTLLAIEAMANFFRKFKKGKVRYNETEAAFDDPYARALGLDVDRVERAECSTVEEFFDDLKKFMANLNGEPGLYILDSLDALSDKAEMQRGIEEGSYGMSKQKQLGQLFRRLVKPLEKANVCLIIISQVRDAIGVTFGNKHTRSGGKALDFYASIILWLAHKGQIKKTIKQIQRTVGVDVKAKTSKNKVGQPFRECEFSILFGYGIDDIRSGLTFLKDAGNLDLVGLDNNDKAASRFISIFMEADKEDQDEMREMLNGAVRSTWYKIEQSFTPTKGKYA